MLYGSGEGGEGKERGKGLGKLKGEEGAVCNINTLGENLWWEGGNKLIANRKPDERDKQVTE